MNYIYKVSAFFCLLALGITAQEKYFNLDFIDNGTAIINLVPENTVLEEENGFLKFKGKHTGRTNDIGLPELPIYSTFFEMQPNTQYEVSYTVRDMYTINDVKLMPAQQLTQIGSSKPPFKFDEQYYDSSVKFPEENISQGEPIVMRNMEMFQLSITPYEYNPATGTLQVYTEIEIEVKESGLCLIHI